MAGNVTGEKVVSHVKSLKVSVVEKRVWKFSGERVIVKVNNT